MSYSQGINLGCIAIKKNYPKLSKLEKDKRPLDTDIILEHFLN